MANKEKNDKELNDYLEGNSDLSKSHRASNTAEPSNHLDEAILSAAKEAVNNSKQKTTPAFIKPRWTLPVSIAAMITLSVSLVVTMQQEVGQPLISGPKIEIFDVADVIDESVKSEILKRDNDASVINEIVKQHKNELVEMELSAPASATLDTAEDSYRAEGKVDALESRMREVAPKKMLLKEKEQFEALEERAVAEEQVLPSAPKTIEFDDPINQPKDRGLSREKARSEVLEERELSDDQVKTMNAGSIGFDEEELEAMDIERQGDELKIIKTLWNFGKFSKAKEIYKKFIEEHPDVTAQSIKEALGENIYNELRDF